MEYRMANGQTLTEETIERRCSYYERGEFPPGERSVEYRRGRPSLSGDALVGDEEILASIGMTEADIDAIVEACEAGDYSMWDSSKVSYRSPLK